MIASISSWLGPFVDRWYECLQWASFIAVLGAGAVTGLTTYAGIRSNKEQSRQIADTNNRAAELSKEAADARLETERIKSLVSWRTLSSEQIKTLQDILSKHPSSVQFDTVANDPEAAYFSNLLSEGFKNWKGFSSSRTYVGAIFFGLIVNGDGDDLELVKKAFTSAGIHFSGEPVKVGSSAVGGFMGPESERPKVTVIIGSKPRPELNNLKP